MVGVDKTIRWGVLLVLEVVCMDTLKKLEDIRKEVWMDGWITITNSTGLELEGIKQIAHNVASI